MFLRQRFITRHRSDILNSLITNNFEKLAPFIRKKFSPVSQVFKIYVNVGYFFDHG